MKLCYVSHTRLGLGTVRNIARQKKNIKHQSKSMLLSEALRAVFQSVLNTKGQLVGSNAQKQRQS